MRKELIRFCCFCISTLLSNSQSFANGNYFSPLGKKAKSYIVQQMKIYVYAIKSVFQNFISFVCFCCISWFVDFLLALVPQSGFVQIRLTETSPVLLIFQVYQTFLVNVLCVLPSALSLSPFMFLLHKTLLAHSSPLQVVPYWGNPEERKNLRKFFDGKNLGTREASFHVVVTSYQIVIQDFRFLNRLKWNYMVLDEAQAIKSINRCVLGLGCCSVYDDASICTEN